ncbi:protein HHL1, chloroplastic-like isoform X2 [Apium graveolens]|uniref:protein HHL1, chloroplastic-like isoform X1 n=1 Tax=Apium graveolens TaxID=4045 RepID=UPI003D7AD406
MEASLCLNAVFRVANSKCCSNEENRLMRHSLICTRMGYANNQKQKQGKRVKMVVKAKGKKSGGMQSRQNKRPSLPSMPKIEEDGNPRFVIFIRNANVYLWYPLSIVAGGTTEKIIVSAKDTFVGKFIYKDTLARNLGAVIYKDEKEIQKTAIKQHRVLRSATEFRYGYKIVENGDMKAAISTNDVVELPRREELKTVVDKVKDFFGDAKESFGKLTSIETPSSTEAEDKF